VAEHQLETEVLKEQSRSTKMLNQLLKASLFRAQHNQDFDLGTSVHYVKLVTNSSDSNYVKLTS